MHVKNLEMHNFTLKRYMWGIQLTIYICENDIFGCTHVISLSYPKSAFVKIHFMQISGSSSQILEFDLYLII